ncbi:hypothetical protein N7532_009321 [Penicillium argentinense]|uniref:Uncharacterized protein n=1 Tax=Penicillium argentinense TaxID=1131581 RepID=A0A9W9EZ58_9EURO|nr:uncharacterized protein N7532_009321 [Penicillium argentinense]KAJ5090637.1 hypothetical protein N7532_009321 [Penicillium argentinense]
MGLLYLFSKKERAKRKNQGRAPETPDVPPAYRRSIESHMPRSAHPRPLSSFAPDYRQSQYLPRASMDQRLPTYDPSKYQPQPSRPISVPGADLSYSSASGYGYGPTGNGLIPASGYGPPARAQPSRLSNVHYTDGRSSIPYQPADHSTSSNWHAHSRRQSAMPFAPNSVGGVRAREGRERSASEPLLQDPAASTRGSRRPKPVLSRLITNFG